MGPYDCMIAKMSIEKIPTLMTGPIHIPRNFDTIYRIELPKTVEGFLKWEWAVKYKIIPTGQLVPKSKKIYQISKRYIEWKELAG